MLYSLFYTIPKSYLTSIYADHNSISGEKGMTKRRLLVSKSQYKSEETPECASHWIKIIKPSGCTLLPPFEFLTLDKVRTSGVFFSMDIIQTARSLFVFRKNLYLLIMPHQ